MPEKPKLTKHFSFYEQTYTTHTNLPDKNRKYALSKLPALQNTCVLENNLKNAYKRPSELDYGHCN